MSQYNPYAAPQAGPPNPTGLAAPQGMGPQPWEIGEVLGHAWNVFKPNWATLVFSYLLNLILGSVPSFIPAILIATSVLDANSTEYWIVYSICTIAGLAVTTFFMAGLIKVWLAAARQQSPQFGDLFAGGARFLPLLASTLLVYVLAIVGFLFLIVPGVIVLLGLSLASFYVVDQGMDPIAAMKASWSATSGQKGKLFLFGLVGALLILGGCVACYLGLFVAFPLLMVGYATIYLRLSGQWGGGMGAPGGMYGPAGGGGYGPPPGGYGPPGGGGYGPPGGGGGFGPPPGGGYGPPAGGGGYGPPGGGGEYGPPTGGGGYGPPGGATK